MQVPLVEPPSPERAAFLTELGKLGYSVGENLIVDYRSAENEPEFLEDLAKELVRNNPEVIVAAASVLAAHAAIRATRTIPIVFIGAPDPVATGLVKSLARPEANVTGVAWESDNLIGKRLELLKELLPGVRRYAAVWNPLHPEAARQLAICRKQTAKAGMVMDEYRVEDSTSLQRAFAAMQRNRPDAVYVITDPRIVTLREAIAAEAIRLRLPSLFGYAGYVLAGGLISYSADLVGLFQRAAAYVVRLLRGAKPKDLPVELPLRYELVLNLKTARAIGLTIPQAILLRADRVIE